MSFEKFFRVVSYAAVFCGFLSLWVSGTFGIVATALFIFIIAAAWFFEDTRWQISEKVGTGLIVLALPAFYLAWRLQFIRLYGGDADVAGILARMILSLTAVKLLQKKGDRDWIFLYLMSFFEVLLAAGLSISALYLGSFLVYLLLMVCSIIAFEIRKTSRSVGLKLQSVPNAGLPSSSPGGLRVNRLPSAAFGLIVLIVCLATPLFFMLPRVGGAGFGGNQRGLRTSSGFSDTVRLGGIGSIQQSNEIAMRVKLENRAVDSSALYFRGIALDTFDNQSWSRSKGTKGPFAPDDRVVTDGGSEDAGLTIQTIYLEPMDTPVLFALSRVVAIKGSFPLVFRDAYGALSYSQGYERVSYQVISDQSVPSADRLRADTAAYTTDVQNYRDLPVKYDIRIAELASRITADKTNRYDKARAVESYLQNNYAYTLDMKAGGEEPLSDFLFNVRAGHCEYFATAMAVMLRTQGIATRIVNGFHGGEYNDAAGVTVVRQRNAHAWVEVYFPGNDEWVRFDPTPFGGEDGAGASTGIAGAFTKYLEALETLWIQHFVSYDDQEQRLLASSVKNGFTYYQVLLASYVGHATSILSEWWGEVRGDNGLKSSLMAIVYGVGYVAATLAGLLFAVWLYRRFSRSAFWRTIWERASRKQRGTIVGFYDRMQRILAERGWTRKSFQTPLEFAHETGIPEAVGVTKRYNSVRFGEHALSPAEADEIDQWLRDLETRAGKNKKEGA